MSKTYEFNKVLFSDKFMWEVQRSGINICLSGIDTHGNFSFVTFKAALSADEEVILNALVAAHDATPSHDDMPMEVSVLEVPKYAINLIDRTYIERSIVIDTGTSQGPFNAYFKCNYPIVMLGGDLYLDPDMKGDSLKIIIHFAPNDIIGALVADAALGDNFVNISSNAITDKLVWKSYELSAIMPDGSDLFLGECVELLNNKVMLDRELTASIPAGSYIKCVAVPVPYLKVTSSVGSIRVGDGTTRGAFVPKDAVLECIYFNNSLKAKSVGYMIEYYV